MCCPRCDADSPDGTKFCMEWALSIQLRYPRGGADRFPERSPVAHTVHHSAESSQRRPPHILSHRSVTRPSILAGKILACRSVLESEPKQVIGDSIVGRQEGDCETTSQCDRAWGQSIVGAAAAGDASFRWVWNFPFMPVMEGGDWVYAGTI